MTTRITADNIVAGTITSDRIAANAVTLDKIAVGTFGPRITGVVLPNSAVAVLPNGSENFTINGSNFQPGVQVYIGTTAAAAVVYVSSTQLVVTVPVMSPGTYALYVTNTDGGTAIRLLAVTVSTAPVWATDSVLPTQFATLSLQLSAVSDSSVIYTLASGSSLPAGLSLSTAGVLSGTISNITSSTTYNFTVVATDLESQTNSRDFSVSITVGDLSFPAVTLLLQTGASLSRSTTVTDVATPLGTFTASGSPTFGLTSPYQPDGYWSNQFNGSTDYLSVAENAALQFGSGNFTIEGWLYPFEVSGNYAMYARNGYGFLIGILSGNFRLYASSNGVSWDLANGISFGSAVANTWFHFAVVRNGSNITLYLNGILGNTVAVSTSSLYEANSPTIGRWSRLDGIIFYASGYISNLRAVKGTAVYTGAFTPPTSPLQTTQSSGTNISAITGTATSLLTCQSNRFIDNSTNNFTITANGTPLVSAETPLRADGYWSNQFNGSTDYAGPDNNAAFQFGANNFTIEYWFNQISRRPSGYDGPFVLTGSMYFTMGNGPSGYAFVAPNQAYIILSNLPSLNTWHHMAIVRNGSTFTAYLNGVSMGTTTFAGALANPTGGFQVGWAGTFDSYFNGYISNFRAVNGIAVYTSNFTPPTAPLTATQSAGTNIAAVTGTATALLTCQSNSFKDNSTNNFAIIRNGSPAIKSAVQLFVSSITSNGAVLFSGSSYLSSASSASFALGTNNFTIEMWVYLTTASGNKVAASFGNFATFDPLIGYLSGGTSFEIRLSSTASSWDLSNGSVLAYTLNLNSWTHIALVRNGSNIALYGNGSSVGSVTSSASIYQSGNNIFLGKGQAAFYFPGYIANYRFVRGTAVYTGNFTPPSNFLTTTGGTYPSTTNVNTSIASTDTALLANLNDSTYLGASTLNTVTRNGNPSTGWVSPYQTDGYWSNQFNGSSQLSLSNNADFEIGAGNFSYEAFVYATKGTNTYAQGIISYGIAGSTGSSTCSMDISSTGFLQFPYATGASATLTDPASFPLNQWVHCVACRSGSTISLFVNGVRKATATTSATVGTGGAMVIGGQWYVNESARQLQNGYISNARVLKGASAYDATLTTLTVPTAPLSPSTANQVLLTCYSNRFIDANTATTAKTITPSGTPTVQSGYYPFAAPTASPGAALFNGSTNYLSIANNSAFTISGNFTVEMWIYPTSLSGTKGLFGQRATEGFYSPILMEFIGAGLRFYVSTSGSSWNVILSTPSLTANVWTHIALVRNGTTVTYYINGVAGVTTGTATGALMTPVAPIYIGVSSGAPDGAGYFPGYISNFRFVNGTPVYTGAFAPPSGPLTQTGGTYPSTTNVNTSIPAANTSLLLNLGDSNYTSAINAVQNNTFIDESNYAFPITRSGTATQGSRTPYWPNGQWSNYFNGSSYIRSPGFNFSTSDFTIECFLNTAFLGSGPQFLGGYDSIGNNYTITMQAAGLITYYLSSDGSNWNIAAGVSLGTAVANRWHHIVIARTGTTIRGYFDGVGGTVITTSAAIFNNATNFWLGAAGSAGGNLTGYLSNVRILNGSSVYNATQPTITVPSAPFATGTTNQVLLTCYSNRFIDANTATTAKTITVTGTPQVQAFQPFSPAASYSAATYAGSGYFNGSGSYLTTPSSAAFDLSGTWSVECFYYCNAVTSSYPAIFSISGNSYATAITLFDRHNSLPTTFSYVVSNTGLVSSSVPAVSGTWYHLALVSNANVVTLYVNGQSSATSTQAVATGNATVYIGRNWDGNSYPTDINGNISNLRVVKGTAVYTGNFTPPTTPVTNTAQTSLLLNMANAGIYDAAAQNVITTVGDAQVSTTITPKWPPSSIKFDGTGDYLTMPLTPATTITSGNFTIEFWLNPSTVATATQAIIGTSEGVGAGTINWLVYLVTSALSFQCYSNASALMVNFSHQTTLSAGTWYYCALTRSGSTFTLYINGVASTSTPTSAATISQSGTTLYVGKFGASSTINALSGYIQDLRMTKGVARTITTPTTAFLTR